MNLLAGACCGMTVDSILFPLDTLKTYCWNERLRNSRFQARAGSVLVSRYHNLFNGLGTILVGSVPASAMYWTIYERVKGETKRVFKNDPRFFPLCEMIAASVGEVIAGSIRNPFEITKQFIQVRGYSSPMKAIVAICKERGFLSLYSGYGIMLMRDIPFDIIEVCFSPFSPFLLVRSL